jgi:hypothetical protein
MLYTLGEKVPESGIYSVAHDPKHARPHDVTCIKGRKFPPCRNCIGVRFELKTAAVHVEDHLYFKTDGDAIKMSLEALKKAQRK